MRLSLFLGALMMTGMAKAATTKSFIVCQKDINNPAVASAMLNKLLDGSSIPVQVLVNGTMRTIQMPAPFTASAPSIIWHEKKSGSFEMDGYFACVTVTGNI